MHSRLNLRAAPGYSTAPSIDRNMNADVYPDSTCHIRRGHRPLRPNDPPRELPRVIRGPDGSEVLATGTSIAPTGNLRNFKMRPARPIGLTPDVRTFSTPVQQPNVAYATREPPASRPANGRQITPPANASDIRSNRASDPPFRFTARSKRAKPGSVDYGRIACQASGHPTAAVNTQRRQPRTP